MITFNWAKSINQDGANPISSAWADTAALAVRLNQTFAGGQTDLAVPFSFNGATLQAAMMRSTQPITVKFGSASSPVFTLSLKANADFEYSALKGYYANPIASSIANIYITTTVAATITAVFGYN